MISRMSFVEIVGPKSAFDSAVDVIQTAGVLHIEEVPLAEVGSKTLLHRAHLPESQVRERRTCEELTGLLTEAVSHIPSTVQRKLNNSPEFALRFEEWTAKKASAMSGTARGLHAKVRSFIRRRRNLQDDIETLSRYEEVTEALSPFLKAPDFPHKYDTMGIVLERKQRSARDVLEREVRQVTADQCTFYHAGVSGGRIAILLAYDRSFSREIQSLIREIGIGEMRGPRHLRGKPFREIIIAIEDDLARTREEEKTLDAQMEEFYSDKGCVLMALQCVCMNRLSKLEAISKFAQSEYTFIIKGWLPRSGLSALKKDLAESCGEGIVIRALRGREAGPPPVQLSNPGLVSTFEPLLGFMPLPKYGSIDPTWFVALFFPPMFGLMLGDIGYGIILALAAALLYRFNGGRAVQKKLAIVLGCCAFFVILFGFFFGEFFGTFGHTLGLEPIWRERLNLEEVDKGKAILGYLLIAVAVGFVHVTSGLVLGIVNAKRVGTSSEMYDRLARLFGVFGIFFIVGRLASFLPPVFGGVGIAALVAFLALMVYQMTRHPLHGLLMPLELLSTVGNILSYARLMAVGLVSVVLAVLANKFGNMIGNVVLAAIVVLLVHSLNLVLGVVDPTIQGLRLHYVEFFSTFYVGGGTKYVPFKRIGGNSP